ncbi:MAG: primosomal replication protein N [Ramlibacter sp.]
MNQVVLTARIAEASALRYTPAGIPALDFRLEHESEIREAGQARQVRAALKAVVIGSGAETLVRQPIGSQWAFTGFLATPRNGKYPVLHIQSFESA